MNNLEMECFNLMKDILENRPKNFYNKDMKYNSEDKSKIIEVLDLQIDTLNNNRKNISNDCYLLLITIYSKLSKLIKSKLI